MLWCEVCRLYPRQDLPCVWEASPLLMMSNLPPYNGASRALARADRASLLEQARALSDGRVAAIREATSFSDAARRLDRGFDLTELCFHRTLRLHQKIASIPDGDLRDLFMMGLEQTLAGALHRVRSYMDG